MKKKPKSPDSSLEVHYESVLVDVSHLIDEARRSAARSVNCIMTAAYWLIGRRIVEFEQGGKERAQYGEELLERLAVDLSARFGRGFSRRNLQDMRLFYLAYPPERIWQTLSAKSDDWGKYATPLRVSVAHAAHPKRHTPSGETGAVEKKQTASAELNPIVLAACFPLPWSAYVRLLGVKNEQARRFYEAEALRGGWSVRQLDRQINSQFYERTALSRNKAAMLRKGEKALPEDHVRPEEEIKDPLVLEFLGLKDEYSETDLEEALIQHLETFLLELGGDFCFVGRQKRLRVSPLSPVHMEGHVSSCPPLWATTERGPPKSMMPRQDIHLPLKWPILRRWAQPCPCRIIPNIFPFGGVTLVAPKLGVPERFLPEGILIRSRPTLGGL